MSRGRARATHTSEALLLRRVEYGEADLIVTLFTRELGRLSALARGARRSRRRFAGALEPFFTIAVRLEENPGAELMLLADAEIVRVRSALLSNLPRMELAGRALSWIRSAAPPRTAEPTAFVLIERFLDRLAEADREHPEIDLAETGLALLAAFGWAIEFERCVRCGKPCAERQAALIDVSSGGLVCTACGGGRVRVNADPRMRLARAGSAANRVLERADAALALTLVEGVLAAHAGIG